MIKNIGIISNIDIDVGLKEANHLAEHILAFGVKVVMPEYSKKYMIDNVIYVPDKDVAKESDLILSIGGDGTFINAVRTGFREKTPLLGVNMGKLGFLTEMEKKDLNSSIKDLLDEKFIIEKRIMLHIDVYKDNELFAINHAINEVVLSKANISKVLRVNFYLDDEFVDSFPGDGMIVSTPTGSTAYSLSAGGPIVQPDLNNIIVTPICPHMLYSRSYIMSDDKRIKFKITQTRDRESVVTIDGDETYLIKDGDWIEVYKSDYYLNMIKMTESNYFKVLREKMHHREENFGRDEIY